MSPAIDLHLGDCLDVLQELSDDSVHAVVTDPPYGLEFMGRAWDGQVPGVAYWRECLRVAKPGAHLVAFGGTRTFHRLAVAIEDAGWDIRDSVAWMHGQGFPKSKSQLKPAFEPILLARRPFRGSEAANVLAHGTGAINVDATRVAHGDGEPVLTPSHTAGRWPANVVLSHDPACRPPECEDSCPVAELDRQSGILKSGDLKPYVSMSGKRGGIMGETVERDHDYTRPGDSGGASRFFPVFRYQAKAAASERPKIDGKGWPTVKPQGLMRWLVRLVTPPGGTVLDPFAGTGSTLQAARDEGFASIGIERDEFAFRLARQRLDESHPDEPPSLLDLLDGEAAS